MGEIPNGREFVPIVGRKLFEFVSNFDIRILHEHDFSFRHKLVRFAHPAMAGLEYWNVGIMGSGQLREWFVGKITLTRHVTNEKVPLKTSSQRRIYIIPPFQYSIIPCARQKLRPHKNPFIPNKL
jgi:hypothetical protein